MAPKDLRAQFIGCEVNEGHRVGVVYPGSRDRTHLVEPEKDRDCNSKKSVDGEKRRKADKCTHSKSEGYLSRVTPLSYCFVEMFLDFLE